MSEFPFYAMLYGDHNNLFPSQTRFSNDKMYVHFKQADGKSTLYRRFNDLQTTTWIKKANTNYYIATSGMQCNIA